MWVGPVAKNWKERTATYKDDGKDGEYHNRTPLFDRFLRLFDSLPGLKDTGLLLFQLQEVLNLSTSQLKQNQMNHLYFTG
jgi:hypothetical protein